MKSIKIPLSVPGGKKSAYLKNFRRLTNGSGNLLLIAGDQKVEHLNNDFYGPGISPEDKNPEHLFRIAAASQGGVLAAHPGLISRYGQDYRSLPYIIKLNGKTNIGEGEKNSSKVWWKVEDVVKFKKQSDLNIVAIGYTLYLGGIYEAKMLRAAAKAIFEAHQAGLLAVLWVYPRGQDIKEEDIHIIAGGAGVAAALDADFVKIKYPYNLKDKKATALKFQEAVEAAGRTKVICVGGDKRPVKEILEHLEGQINISKAAGMAIGRNLHQRPLEEATRLNAALGAIIFHGKNAKEALAIYNTKLNLRIKHSSRLLGLF
ncbi:MAG: aldolase [Patescibacteria group bacterium]|jgi:fructose-bisphosphate aldolase/6-deoxy-5-ketofructose 1-phosphate synthase